jgi:predicted ferric reductase
MEKRVRPNEPDEMPPVMNGVEAAMLLLAAALGAAAALVTLPTAASGLMRSLSGPEPKSFWYLSRSSGLVAYALTWLSMLFGVGITNRLARLWPGGPAAFDLHQHTALLGLAFALFHGLILLGDQYTRYTPLQLLVPFASSPYRPLAVGLGQVGFYLLALVGLSFYVRRLIGQRFWRAIHYLSFGVYVLALAHGLAAGTDTASPGMGLFYWATAGGLLFLTTYRVLLRWPAAQAGA